MECGSEKRKHQTRIKRGFDNKGSNRSLYLFQGLVSQDA